MEQHPDPRPRLSGLLAPDAPAARFAPEDGFADFLQDTPAPSPIQRVMELPLLAHVYERWWRPAGALAFMGFDVGHFRTEKNKAVQALRLAPGDTVLDAACGPGNFTSAFAAAVGGGGLAVGLDLSVPMLRRAGRTNPHPDAVYVRGDAHHLPFKDGAFDAVNCYAALYLIPQPFAALAELVRVLRPGGRLALMTSRQSPRPPVSAAQRVVLGRMGLTMFGPDEFTGALRAAGFTDITQEVHGVAQYVAGTRA